MGIRENHWNAIKQPILNSREQRWNTEITINNNETLKSLKGFTPKMYEKEGSWISIVPDSYLLKGFYKCKGKTSWKHNIQETTNVRFHIWAHSFRDASNTSQSLRRGFTSTWSNLQTKEIDNCQIPCSLSDWYHWNQQNLKLHRNCDETKN